MLYYKIEKSDKKREIKFTPIAINDDKLIIKSIMLDDKEYTDFDQNKRLIKIKKGEGGIFKVTYAIK